MMGVSVAVYGGPGERSERNTGEAHEPTSPEGSMLRLATAAIPAVLGGIVTAKVTATLLGPSGVGQLAAVQSVAGFVTLVADFNIGQGLARLSPSSADDFARERLFRTARVITIGGGLIAVALAAIAGWWFAGGIVGSPATLVLAALAGSIGMAVQQELNILAARRLVRVVAIALAIQGLVVPAITCLTLVLRGRSAIALAGVLGASGAFVLVQLVTRRATRGCKPSERVRFSSARARELLQFGRTMTATAVVGSGSLLVLPLVVRHFIGFDGAGQYRAATTLSIGYLTIITGALARDYYPRLCAAASSDERQQIVESQLRLILVVVTPILVATSTLAPLIVKVLFSERFGESAGVIEIMVVGDVLKLGAWCFTYALLASSSPSRLLSTEACGAVLLVGGTWVATAIWHLQGSAVAFVIAYAAYLLLTMHRARRWVGITISRATSLHFLLAVGFTAAPVLCRHLFAPTTAAILSCATFLACSCVTFMRFAPRVQVPPHGRRYPRRG